MPRTAAGAAPAYGDLVRQYLEIRDQHPGTILLYRVGSFYETLFDDAELVARELGLKLSERPSGGAAPSVPQCGFAHHALDNFLPRLLRHGYRVAVCEETDEDAGGLRRRAVVRTLTPGTVTDPALLPEDRPAYLVALVTRGDDVGLAWTDVATGEFRVGEFGAEEAAAEVQRLDPAEILVPAGVVAPAGIVARRSVTPVPAASGVEALLAQTYPDADLAELPLARAAGGVILRYLHDTAGAEAPPLDVPLATGADDYVRLDAATQRHLELVETERGREREGSLLATIDRTVTPMGRRMLRSWLLRPLVSLSKIAVRQRMVAELVRDERLRTSLVEQLGAFADLERLAGRAAAGRASVDDLRALAAAAQQLPALARAASAAQAPFLRALAARRTDLVEFAARVEQTLAPAGASTGYAVRPEASPALGQALALLSSGAEWQARYLDRLRRTPGLDRAKIERTSTQGFFLEVPVNTAVPPDWVRRGGLQRVERYSTPTLEQHAAQLAEAEEIAETETRALVAELRAAAVEVAPAARDLARHLAAVDALVSMARVAAERGWVQPLVDESAELTIQRGRHPVVERDAAFQPNDAHLVAQGERDQVVVLTGPNMAGKSTWMRQVALITLLAQAGMFVPAVGAHIGVVDAIFTRIGAVDDLASGRSTFMVEMLETAAVLRGASDRSFVLLDEIGRGTSTHDGMAIAWAVIEHFVTGPVRPRAIIATHYHELAALAAVHSQVTLLRAAVEEDEAGVRFPHRVEPGAADRSFGIEVARLAGLPRSVLDRAQQVADAVEPLSAEIGRHLGSVAKNQKLQNELGVHAATAPAGRRSPRNAHP